MVIEDMIAMASVKKVQSKLPYFDLTTTDFFISGLGPSQQ